MGRLTPLGLGCSHINTDMNTLLYNTLKLRPVFISCPAAFAVQPPFDVLILSVT